MDIIILITVLLAAAVFGIAAGKGKIDGSFIFGAIGVVFLGLLVYFCMPALTTAGIISIIAIGSVCGGAIGLSDTGRHTNTTLPAIALLGGLAIIIIVAIAICFAPLLCADQMYSLPRVTVHQESNMSLVSSDHIREVSEETAKWRSDKVIGTFGYKDQVGHLNIQTINGSLAWLAPLDYNGLWKSWSYGNEGTDGYAIVSAEDSKAQVILVTGIPMRYTEEAIFGYDLQRNIYVQYPGYYMGEHTFQLDDKENPKWVTMVSDPAFLGVVGDNPRGVIITDPINGGNEFYNLDSVPSWVERVMDEKITERYLEYWGKYKYGFWNTWFGQKDYLVPTGGLELDTSSGGGAVTVHQSSSPDVYMVRGTDGRLYWFGSLTTVGKDSSMVGYMLTDLRTGKFNFYPSPSIYNDIGAAKNTQQNPEVAKVMGARVTQPIMYMINGEEMWIMPVITQSGENVMMGVVRAKTGETFVAPDLKTALGHFDKNVVVSLPTSGGTSLDEIISDLTITLDQLKQYKKEHNIV